jgi:undecaprenyl-diphosphatase
MGAMTGYQLGILAIGCVVAFIVSMFIIKFLMNFIKKHDFKPFAYYRILLGIVVLVLLFTHVI